MGRAPGKIRVCGECAGKGHYDLLCIAFKEDNPSLGQTWEWQEKGVTCKTCKGTGILPVCGG